MPALPAQPHLNQLRRQARDLLRSAKAGDSGAVDEIRAVAGELTLAAAQLAVARSYGFASWPRLKEAVEARNLDLAESVAAFCEASVGGRIGRAARLLQSTPAIADYSFATAVILGNADRVEHELERRPALATRPEPRSGWRALHAVVRRAGITSNRAVPTDCLQSRSCCSPRAPIPSRPPSARGRTGRRCAV